MVISGGLYNVTNATCGMICQYCNGFSNLLLVPGPFSGAIGSNWSLIAQATDSYGSKQTLSGGSWSSGTPSVMTASNGANGSGSVHAAGVGQASILDFLQAVSVYQGQFCVSDNMNDACPTANETPQTTGTATPTVTIDSFSPNPIAGGGTASVHITVTPSANIALTISQNGTGSATFGTSGNTTLQIAQTTTVTITAGTESNGSADLTLSASYGSNLLATYAFSVTTGACTLMYSGNGGGGAVPCPRQVTFHDSYNMKEYCSSCSFSCVPVQYDSTFAPSSGGCGVATGGLLGAGNQTLTSTASGNFAAHDCLVHNVQIKTTVTNARGTTTTNYTGGSFGLKCNSNGSPSCP